MPFRNPHNGLVSIHYLNSGDAVPLPPVLTCGIYKRSRSYALGDGRTIVVFHYDYNASANPGLFALTIDRTDITIDRNDITIDRTEIN